MRLGHNRLKLRNGKILHFKSKEDLEKYENYNNALKHGWHPKHHSSGSRHTATWRGKH
jgi:hypothetical protein